MKYAMQDLEDIYSKLQTDPNKGLTNAEVESIREVKGLNAFEEEKKDSVFKKVLHHMRDFTCLILFLAGGIALYSSFMPDSDKGITDAIVIFAIVILNLTLAVRQEISAEKALEALKSMTAQMTSVLRNGVRQTINAEEVVPGDILMLDAGDMIPADARIIDATGLKVDESILTGESVPVEKDPNAQIDEKASVGDQLNMLFSGCLLTNGKVRAVVVETGMTTEMGKIAGLLSNTKKERTPLQRKMDTLVKIICVIAVVSSLTLFTLQWFAGQEIMYILLSSVALMVAAIPEGLPIILTITLAYGILNMAKKNAIIRKIPAVETLGSASVICSDKTGTLTQNKMTIKNVWAIGSKPADADGNLSRDEMRILKLMSLASNASISYEDGVEKSIGDPTETAIIRLMNAKSGGKMSVDTLFPRVHEIPFDSERKRMTTVHDIGKLNNANKFISITKGAFERLPIDTANFDLDTAERVHDEFAEKALRVLGVAFKFYDKLPEVLDVEELENGLTFAGFVGMIDPARPESAEAVRIAKEAGIKCVMITGDHAKTAAAIARDIGILGDGDKVVTGVELAEMTQDDLNKSVRDVAVYARVSPEDKISIVQAWQSYKEVVSMTGDGVNDAPALKAADVGVAMGSGTDVSKSASDIILTDDNFASIVSAVSEGRRVYDNIRKVIISLVPSNISEIVVMILGFIIWNATPLAALQLLFINVVADGIPDLCMCREPLEPDAMRRKPIPRTKSVFAYGMGIRTSIAAVNFTVVSMLGYFIGRFVEVVPHITPSHEVGMTMAYVTLAFASVVNIMNVRSFNQSLFKIGFTSNRLLFGGFCLSISLIVLTAAVPGIQDIFSTVPLSIRHWLIMVGMGITPFFLIETIKIFIRRKLKRQGALA